MKIAALGSGSGGNAFLIASERTALLVDGGFSARQLVERLEALGVDPASVQAIVVTHEHSDHTRGIGVFSRRFGTALHMTAATRGACARLLRGDETIRLYEPGRGFTVGDLRVEAFLTVHDALDPVAVTVTGLGCGTRIGIVTDLGRPTAGIRHSLGGCDFLVLEANHDEGLLRAGSYPAAVQARIASSHGHLSNRAAASFARELLHPGLTGILLAHLSEECNRPHLARQAVGTALKEAGWSGFLEVASQDEPTSFVDVSELRLGRAGGQLSLL
ncbi:MAG: MBL fold metallo-hydrolase [Gemmatimonadetes bacterium]|nr:MBL fold metallo-hydrolase [Gemmatimonadota bacterium]